MIKLTTREGGMRKLLLFLLVSFSVFSTEIEHSFMIQGFLKFTTSGAIIIRSGSKTFIIQKDIYRITHSCPTGVYRIGLEKKDEQSAPTYILIQVESCLDPNTNKCPEYYRPVCGFENFHCPKGRICAQRAATPKTYSNICELTRNNASFLHNGKCQTNTSLNHSLYKNKENGTFPLM